MKHTANNHHSSSARQTLSGTLGGERRWLAVSCLVAGAVLSGGTSGCSGEDTPAMNAGGASLPVAGSSAGGAGGSDGQSGGSGGNQVMAGGAGGNAGGMAGDTASGGDPSGGDASGGDANGGDSTGGEAMGGNAGDASGGEGGTGGVDGEAPVGTCPTQLPTLAADNDTSFYQEDPNIPHGMIETVMPSNSNSKTMRVYTPPGYDADSDANYPVLYINHGGGEGDAHWGCTDSNNCGYAGVILDKLIAAGEAVPMIIAMPDTGDCANFDSPEPPDYEDPCTTQYVNDFIPYVEANYRAKADRNARAIAGLSMGGLVTLSTGFAHLEIFSEVYVYSSGYIDNARTVWEMNLSEYLDDPERTNGLLNVPVYLAAGDTDTALPNAMAVRDIFEEHGVKTLWQQSSFGHEWRNWRRYLAQTLPLMFQNNTGCN